jgi:hypothetical protein
MISQNFYPEIGSAGNRAKNIFQLLQGKGYQIQVSTTESTYPNKDIYQDSRFWNEENLNITSSIIRVKMFSRNDSKSIFTRLIYYLEMAFRMVLYVLKIRKGMRTIFVSSPPIFVGFVGLIAKVRYKGELILDIRDLWSESLKGVGIKNV